MLGDSNSETARHRTVAERNRLGANKASESKADLIPVPSTVGEQAFRLIEVLDQIGTLQCEKNILQGKLASVDGVQVAHGPDFDVIIEDGVVRKAKHVNPNPNRAQRLIDSLNAEAPAGKVVNGALQVALLASLQRPIDLELKGLELELQAVLKKIIDAGYIPTVRMHEDQADIEIRWAGYMYVGGPTRTYDK